MYRALKITVFACLLTGCGATEIDKDVTEISNLSDVSFSKTVRFPLETVLPLNPLLDTSCTLEQEVLPFKTNGQFLSFRYQKCDSKSVKTVVDNDSLKINMMSDMPVGQPLEHKYPPLKIQSDNRKSPEDYLKDLYMTEEEAKYCKRVEKSANIWEFKNIGFSPIQRGPSNEEIFADWTPPPNLSKRQLEELRGTKISEVSREHYARFVEQETINRVCDNLPLAAYIFFEDEYVLIMPRYFAPILDITSIKYHVK